MRRALTALGLATLGAAMATWWPAVRCALRGQHNPVRTPLGLRCLDCKTALSDYGEAGTMDGGHVQPLRGDHWFPRKGA